MQKNTLLWLSNENNSLTSGKEAIFHPLSFKNNNVIIIHTFIEFKNWIKDNGLPNGISFDYDLGDTKYVSRAFMEKSTLKTIPEKIFYAETGITCVAWLIGYCSIKKIKLPHCTTHSINASANALMRNALSGYIEKYEKKIKVIPLTLFDKDGNIQNIN